MVGDTNHFSLWFTSSSSEGQEVHFSGTTSMSDRVEQEIETQIHQNNNP
jgi:hypothetical protein